MGFRDKAAGAPMPADAIFRIASMTKPLASVAAMMLYEEGRLFVNDPVSKYIPVIGKMQVGVERVDPMTGKTVLALVPAEREMTIQDLLRHTSGLTSSNRGKTTIHQAYPGSGTTVSRELTSAEFMERLSKAPLLFHPGTHWEYGVSSDVLGRVVEVVSGKSLGQFLTEAHAFATDPDTGKPVSIFDAATPAKFECGGGCAVSTAGDYVRFAQMLLNRGSLDGARVLGRKTVEYMTAGRASPAPPATTTGAAPTAPPSGSTPKNSSSSSR